MYSQGVGVLRFADRLKISVRNTWCPCLSDSLCCLDGAGGVCEDAQSSLEMDSGEASGHSGIWIAVFRWFVLLI